MMRPDIFKVFMNPAGGRVGTPPEVPMEDSPEGIKRGFEALLPLIAFMKDNPMYLPCDELVPIDKIHTNKKGPSDFSSVPWFVESLSKFGNKKPVLLKPDGALVDGIHRVAAMRIAGHKHVRVNWV